MSRLAAGTRRSRPAGRGRVAIVIGLTLAEAGCSRAPAQDILGSFFPAWLLCAAIGVASAAVCYRLIGLARLNDSLLVAPLTYLAIAVAATLLVWLGWFAH